jgi:hypothetical protein
MRISAVRISVTAPAWSCAADAGGCISCCAGGLGGPRFDAADDRLVGINRSRRKLEECLIYRGQGRSAALSAEPLTDERFLRAPLELGSGVRAGICVCVLEFWIHPPSRRFSEARMTARILANSAVSDMSGSLLPPAADVFRRRTVVIHGQVLLQKLDRVPGMVRPWPWRAARVHDMRRRRAPGPLGLTEGASRRALPADAPRDGALMLLRNSPARRHPERSRVMCAAGLVAIFPARDCPGLLT